MFGSSKKKQRQAEQKKQEENKKKQKYLDKLIMGAVLGGAIGSVLGLSLAPKKGKETREIIAQKSSEIIYKVKDGVHDIANTKDQRGLLTKMSDLFKPKKKLHDKIKEKPKKIPNEIE